MRSMPAAVSTAVGPAWRGPDREVEVLAVFPRAIYAIAGDDLLVVATADGIHQPNGAVVRPTSLERPFAGVRAGQHGRVGDHRLTVEALQVTVARWWEPTPRLAPFDPSVLADRAAIAAVRVRSVAGELPAMLRRPLTAVVAGLAAADPDIAFDAAIRLVGAGPGLTPAGDDLMAGVVSGTLLLASGRSGSVRSGSVRSGSVRSGSGRSGSGRVSTAAAALGARIAAAAPGRTTTISAALLQHAARAEVAVPAARFLHALTGRVDIVTATDGLLAVGSTSGRDLAVGMLAAVTLVLDDASTVGDDRSIVHLTEAC